MTEEEYMSHRRLDRLLITGRIAIRAVMSLCLIAILATGCIYFIHELIKYW
jgi:hypothetical protein